MSQQNPYPQQPNGPQWGQQPGPYGQQPPQSAPQPPKKGGAGKKIGIGCGGLVGLVIIIGIIAAIASSGGSDSTTTADKATTAASQPANAPSAGDDKAPSKAAAPAKKADKKTVTFKVWGDAPAGALGSIDITYGSDSDTRQGKWKNGGFTATMPYTSDAMFYTLTAQLQGSGDIQCSVTVDGHTKKAHASGGYNICDAQLSAGILGGWS